MNTIFEYSYFLSCLLYTLLFLIELCIPPSTLNTLYLELAESIQVELMDTGPMQRDNRVYEDLNVLVPESAIQSAGGLTGHNTKQAKYTPWSNIGTAVIW